MSWQGSRTFLWCFSNESGKRKRFQLSRNIRLNFRANILWRKLTQTKHIAPTLLLYNCNLKRKFCKCQLLGNLHHYYSRTQTNHRSQDKIQVPRLMATRKAKAKLIIGRLYSLSYCRCLGKINLALSKRKEFIWKHTHLNRIYFIQQHIS